MRSVDFWGWFQSLQPNAQFLFFCVAIGMIVVMTAIICFAVVAIHRRRAEVELKRELLERGMSADEIATIISAKPGATHSHRPTQS